VRPSCRYYVIAVSLAGPAAAGVWAALGGWQEAAAAWHALRLDILFFLVLGCLLGMLTVPIARGGEMSAGLAALLAALLVIGPLPTAAIAALSVLVAGILKPLLARRGRERDDAAAASAEEPAERIEVAKILFNIGHIVLAILAAGLVYYGHPGSAAELPRIGVPELLRGGAAVGVVMLIEISALSVAVSMDKGLPLVPLWRDTALQIVPADLTLGGLGLLVAIIYMNKGQIFGAAGMRWSEVGFVAVVLLVPSGLLYYASRLKSDMWRVYKSTLTAFGHLVEARLQAVDPDQPIREHGRQVARLAAEVAERLPFTEEEVQRVRWAAQLHEIGKAAMPVGSWDAASSQPTETSGAANYAEIGYMMLREVEFLRLVSLLVRYHARPYREHKEERDGMIGALAQWQRPRRWQMLHRNQPPADLVLLGAQVLHAVDFYDSALGDKDPSVLAYMKSESEKGGEFHPAVVEALERVVLERSEADAAKASRAGREVHAL